MLSKPSVYPLASVAESAGTKQRIKTDKRMCQPYPLSSAAVTSTKRGKMGNTPRKVIRNAPWSELTYEINGLAMEVHNELGPGHREWDYHRALAAKLKQAGRSFEFEPDLPVALEDGTVVGGNYPDLVVENTVIVELKARPHSMTKDDEAQVIGYFAVLPECPVALFLNFGCHRLEHRRLLPPQTVQAYQRQQEQKMPDKQKHSPPAAEKTSIEQETNQQLAPNPSAYPLPSVAATAAKIDHIGIVVRDIQEALIVYETALGLPLREVAEVPDQKVEVAFLPLGESNIELVQPLTDDTGIAKYLEKRGEGIHHICIEVDDIEATLARLKAHGVQLIDEAPRQGAHGRVAFVYPKAMHGVLIELVEHDQS
jgi:methylmalonyl-CoA epimerase